MLNVLVACEVISIFLSQSMNKNDVYYVLFQTSYSDSDTKVNELTAAVEELQRLLKQATQGE